jgi:PAS domain S-box-containing protein
MSTPLQALIVEDSADDAALLVRTLRSGGFDPIYTRVDNARDLRAALGEAPWELIICDHAMPQFDSFAALALVQEAGLDVPFIVVSGVIGEEVAVATMKAGAHDYLMKDNLLRLVPAIARELHEAEERRQRRQAEEALRTSEEWLRALIEHSPAAILLKDTEHRYLLVNKRFEQWYGMAQEDVVGKRSHELLPPEEAEVYEAQDREVLAARTAIVWEVTVSFADGTQHQVLVTKYPVFDARGKPVGVCTINTDITEQKQLEDVLLRARKIESIGVLAGGIAHDFNNLLTGIMGNISLTKMLVGQETQAVARLTEAENACRRATALTRQLLTFSTGGAPVRQTISMVELLTESVKFALRGSNVRAAFTIAENLWPADVDAGQIDQVFHNVAINAVQAMPDGGVVHVQADNCWLNTGEVPSLAEGRYLKMSLRDHGSGISAEALPNIFDPYFTTKEHGSGLGLATAYAIITKHGGAITVESEDGVGTTFVIYLPATQGAILPVQDAPDTPLLGSGRILVVDDEAAIRDLLQAMLTTIGYEVVCVRDGAEAIAVYQKAQAEERPFAATILDITIPGGMGGLEALPRLRALDPQATVLISSGYANDPVMADFQRYAINGVIAKPYTVQKLHDALQHAIEG